MADGQFTNALENQHSKRTREMKLKGKIAIVTGAGQGIGRGIAQYFAKEGADVVVADLVADSRTDEVRRNIECKGSRALVVQADVSKRADVERIFDETWKQLGPADILVNNAGIETIIPITDLTDEQWEAVTEVNLKGEWMCCQSFCKRLLAEKRRGSIVNIGSVQAGKVLPGRTHYAPSKLAIEALTRNLAAEMGEHGIRANCIHPGLIETPMVDWVLKSPDILPQVLAQISLGRPGKPCEIGAAAAFLASDEASYVTGQSLYVDGLWAGR
jgi:glucose 1-dehydrogenase/3-oxoacyl-[acyl-carrier protein] reductase